MADWSLASSRKMSSTPSELHRSATQVADCQNQEQVPHPKQDPHVRGKRLASFLQLPTQAHRHWYQKLLRDLGTAPRR